MTPLPTLTYPEDPPHVSPIDILLNLERALGGNSVPTATYTDAPYRPVAVPSLSEMPDAALAGEPLLVMPELRITEMTVNRDTAAKFCEWEIDHPRAGKITYETNQDHHHVPTREMQTMSQEAYGGNEGDAAKAPGHDPINNPRHYTSHPSGIKCIEITRHMSFNIGNAMKYLWRADEKGAPIEDLRKAIWYIQDEINARSQT